MWVAESVQNEMNLHSGELVEERRTDIVYGWNNEKLQYNSSLNSRKCIDTRVLGEDILVTMVSVVLLAGYMLKDRQLL